MKQVKISKEAFLTAMVTLEADARHQLIGLLFDEDEENVTIVLPEENLQQAA